jgi:hypothetical protein
LQTVSIEANGSAGQKSSWAFTHSIKTSERWRSVMLVAEGDGRRDLQGGTLTDFE